MESHSIDLGTYNLFNVPINLVLEIKLYKNFRGSQVAKAIIPLPLNYPLTQTGTSNIVKSKGLFEAEISVITDKNISWYYYPMDLIGNNIKRVVVLNKFYNVPKSENLDITPEENLIFVGLGKRFICITFPYIVKFFNIDSNQTPIILQASGGAIRNDNDRFRVERYLKLGRLNILQIYQNKYREDFESSKILFNNYSDQELAEALVSLENNEKLIGYYSTVFGFRKLDYISMETKMATSLNTFLSNCADPVII